ncbi:MAG: enoyl-CoA hydratase [Rhodobacteraceae bacterium]|nr:enoyl-CoA hydratase [Paracoccaceae bacterium]
MAPTFQITASDSPISLTRSDNVATVTLNRPKAINALSEATLEGLIAAFGAIAEDRSIRAVLLRGDGAHFCAGHDLREMTLRRQDPDGGRAYFQMLFETCSRMMLSVTRLPQPVIAEVRGIATAAGCQLVAACDLAVAADTARFATSGVNLGLFCSTPMVPLSRVVARKHAMEMLLLGDFVPAERAAEIGLVNRVVSEDMLAETALVVAEALASKSPAALRMGKRAFYDQAEMSLEEAYAHGGRVMAENMMASDAAAGIGAFLDKRPAPEWTGD